MRALEFGNRRRLPALQSVMHQFHHRKDLEIREALRLRQIVRQLELRGLKVLRIQLVAQGGTVLHDGFVRAGEGAVQAFARHAHATRECQILAQLRETSEDGVVGVLVPLRLDVLVKQEQRDVVRLVLNLLLDDLLVVKVQGGAGDDLFVFGFDGVAGVGQLAVAFRHLLLLFLFLLLLLLPCLGGGAVFRVSISIVVVMILILILIGLDHLVLALALFLLGLLLLLELLLPLSFLL
mmetsp:Transcript_6429/g.18976  ORF Transcript_6429/g.18976 Transcript_6429/m.18976 type:complete len:237 (+) Transcript_6429:1814-2524(+)